ncbi:hypothetical protein AT05_01435 [Schleiferia thermophila str. Yellowstone]|uniref:hypothetical protein n=1 Tax=Schleiferia thermophila TaxID=884107 RepID=UPI0004E78453|nr:hypothetical protein [Schleiferia thermophila]KFD40297.1 hypothetical protein AT05_01435 [Schleiferia thermophila str. Yellowstone]
MTDKDNYIKDLYEDLKYSVSKFDSQALAISGGALGISLTFIKEIVPFENSVYTSLFYIALGLFIFTLTIGFVGHYLSSKQILDSIEKVSNEEYGELKSDKWIPRLNMTIVIALPLGIVFLVTYCIINIETLKRTKTDNPMTQKVIIDKGTQNGEHILIEGELKTFQFTDTTNTKTNIKIE